MACLLLVQIAVKAFTKHLNNNLIDIKVCIKHELISLLLHFEVKKNNNKKAYKCINDTNVLNKYCFSSVNLIHFDNFYNLIYISEISICN